MLFSTIFTALFYPYIAHERTAQYLILSVRSLRFALFVKERHCSQNEGSLKSEERLSNFKERCAQLCLFYIKIIIVCMIVNVNLCGRLEGVMLPELREGVSTPRLPEGCSSSLKT